jgi:UDP-2,3-diacylglucosamine pyrophosphatase LpxH
MDRHEAYLFNQQKEVAFCELARTVLKTDGQLVLAGDIFDFTGLTPCRFGQAEFFSEAVPQVSLSATALKGFCQLRSTEELLMDIKNVFSDFFAALASLAAAKKLIYIPGNHDCDFLTPASASILSHVLKVPATSIHWTRQFTVGSHLVIAHGNEFDRPNQTTRGCMNQGFIFTSALYNSVLPALKMLDIDPQVVAAIPAVRPEEATVTGLQYHLGTKACQRLLLAFVRLLQRNGFFSGPSAVPAWFLTHDAPWISQFLRNGVTTKRVRGLLPREEFLIESGRAGAKALREALQAKDPQFKTAMVVLGHTHELDLQEHYVNLGTWIDHITGLHPVEISVSEPSLPVLVVSGPGAAELYNIRDLLEGDDLLKSPKLQSWPWPTKTS